MAPAAVGVLPYPPAVLGGEGIERARHSMVCVVRVRLGLGQQNHTVVIHHHRQEVLEHSRVAHPPHRAGRQHRAVIPPDILACVHVQALDRFCREHEDLAIAGGQFKPAERVLCLAGSDAMKRAFLPEHPAGLDVDHADVLAGRARGSLALLNRHIGGLFGRIYRHD